MKVAPKEVAVGRWHLRGGGGAYFFGGGAYLPHGRYKCGGRGCLLSMPILFLSVCANVYWWNVREHLDTVCV